MNKLTTEHSANCILRNRCRARDTDACTRICPSYIAMRSLTGAAGVPDDYRLLTAKSPAMSAIVHEQSELGELIDKYIGTFSRVFESDAEPIKSLYLFSRNPGTGKTTTAAALLNEFAAEYYVGCLRNGRQPESPAVYFLDTNAWQTLYNEFNRAHIPQDVAESAAGRYYREMARAKSAKFAVLDDIGVRGATEAFRADLHDVINTRVTAGLPTVYTSNIPMNELRHVFDDRLADRIRDRCVDVAFKGESKRGRR